MGLSNSYSLVSNLKLETVLSLNYNINGNDSSFFIGTGSIFAMGRETDFKMAPKGTDFRGGEEKKAKNK